jgi:nicotinate-nucleotide adenylyltransferase
MSKTIALFFGSFNPIHLGHLVIAQSVLTQNLADEIWFVISPHNPFKSADDLLDEQARLQMVNLSIVAQPRFKSCDIEFDLPKPNYTINTLNAILEKHPNKKFKILIGEDNLVHFHLWNDYEEILEKAALLVYPRPNTPDCKLKSHAKVSMLDVPLFDISATYIRALIQQKKSIKYLVHEAVESLIEAEGYYVF